VCAADLSFSSGSTAAHRRCGIGSRALHHSTIRTQTQSQNQTQSQSHAQASPLPDPGLCRHCCRPPQRLQLQQAGDEWGRWEWRVLSVYPEEEADPILDLHTHAMNVHNGFGSVSRLCPSIPEADRRSGGAYSREADIGLAPAKRMMDLEKAHPAAKAKRYKIMRVARYGRL